jgi:acetyl esterase/lipase
MSSPQFLDFAQRLGRVRELASTPGLSLDLIREVCESFHRATAEPIGVSYEEVDIDGLPAMWCIPDAASPRHALLHFHFGGAVVASMHTDRKAAAHIAKAAGMRTLVVDFRRAPESPFPAQLDDAEAAYGWLLQQGFCSRHIGSVGHSIGGTLAVQLPLRLAAQGKPTPGAVLSISPWCDPTMSDPSIDANADNDKMLSRGLLEMFRGALLDAAGVDRLDPRVNLNVADLSPLPPTYLAFGEFELLAGEARSFGRRLESIPQHCEIHPLAEGQHSFILGAGRVPEVDSAIMSMGAWLKSVLGATE